MTNLLLGDNIQSLKKLEANSVDSVVTDPPYALNFMNKKWDAEVPSVDFWKEVYRVLKPGGHVLSFGGTRTYHRMTVNIEDAGFEIRDQIMWLYGAGFPKSHNIGKAVDKIEGNKREVVGKLENYQDKSSKGKNGHMMEEVKPRIDMDITKGTSEWEGWGSSLKPAVEPICVARKPLSEKTIAENVLRWGTGGINIDGCRVEGAYGSGQNEIVEGKDAGQMYHRHEDGMEKNNYKQKIMVSNPEGRFPANIILDEEAGAALDEQSGISKTRADLNYKHNKTNSKSGIFKSRGTYTPREDKGGASRFFYCPKVSKKERNLGLEPTSTKNSHPTLKPINLMAYLCRLVTPPNGTVLDPFMGSGSTGIAAKLEGFDFIGMEMDEDYFKVAETRVKSYEKYRELKK